MRRIFPWVGGITVCFCLALLTCGCGVSRRLYLRAAVPVGGNFPATDASGAESESDRISGLPEVVLPEPTVPESPAVLQNEHSKPAQPTAPPKATIPPAVILPVPEQEPDADRLPRESVAEPLLKTEKLEFVRRAAFTWTKGMQWAATTGTKQPRPVQLEPRGAAEFDEDGRMTLHNGAVLIPQVGRRLLNQARRSNELTLEAVIISDKANQSGPARIVSFSGDENRRNFTLGQQGQNLVWRLRTTNTDDNGTQPQLTLTKVEAGKPMHIVITYKSGLTTCWINGQAVLQSEKVTGTFRNWEPFQLIFGDEVNGHRDWNGRLEHLRIGAIAVNDAAATTLFLEWAGSSPEIDAQ